MFLICGISADFKVIYVIDTSDKAVEMITGDMLAEYAKDGVNIYGATVDVEKYISYGGSEHEFTDAQLSEIISYSAPVLNCTNIEFIDVQVEPVVTEEQVQRCILSVSYKGENGFSAEVGIYERNGYSRCDIEANSTQRVTIRLRKTPIYLDYVMGELYREEGRANLMHTSILRYYEYGYCDGRYEFCISRKD